MISSKIMIALFAAGLGFGYSIEHAEQGVPLVSLAPQRDPAWLRDLDSGYQDLVHTMRQKGFTIEENASVCKQLDVLGFYASGQRAIKICTDRLAQLYGESSAFLTILQQTIAHEAVHVAQGCRQRRSGKPSLDLPAARLYGLPKSVRADIQKGLAMNTSSLPRSVQWRNEAEAMAMEDQPEHVIAALQQFCR
jgi:hypothetical protein